jgi:hypothetical protein
MSNSMKLAALFLWVLSAIYIKEDAKQTIRDYHPVASYDHTSGTPGHMGGDSVAVILTKQR